MTTHISTDFIGRQILIERRKEADDSRDRVRLSSRSTVDGSYEKMALQTDIGKKIPQGALRLTQEEALYHQRTVIRKWPTESEVTFLRYGNAITSLTNMASSAVIANYFSQALRVGMKPTLMGFLPSVLMPGIVGYFLSDRILTQNVLLMKVECPVCLQIKFALSQCYTGIVFPTAYSYFSYAGAALASKSYPLPDINKDAKEFWRVSFRILKDGARMFYIAGCLQSVLVLFLPYLQNSELLTVMTKLREKENAVQNGSLVDSDKVDSNNEDSNRVGSSRLDYRDID